MRGLMPGIVIRQVEPIDLETCVKVEAKCFPPEEAASSQNIKKRITLYPEGFWVAQKQGKVVGFVNSGATNQDDISDEAFKALSGHNPLGKNIVIFSLAVAPEAQKQGIAHLLMHRFIDESKALRKKNILLLCKEHMISFYQKFGFSDAGESASNHGGAKWHEMLLKL
ncbi:GNAT family N-acetyltransferase [Dethiosulfatarculus sandiegensis]|nr:N-acetyltransferase [Dethiosulfatarculus sandiegensis]